MIAGNTGSGEAPFEGDMAFQGVNMRLRPNLLPPGYVSEARNARFTRGTVAPRKGVYLLTWTNTGGTGIEPLPGTVAGACVFQDPNGQTWFIFAIASGGVWFTSDFLTARELTLPEGETIPAVVEFTQAFDVLLMWRGKDLAPLVLRDINQRWEVVLERDNDPALAALNPDDGTERIPNAEWGVAMQNRVFVPNAAQGKDIISASDYLNYTRYQPVLESFRVNQGDSQALVGAYEFPSDDGTSSSAMVVFKEASVFVITGLYGDLSEAARHLVTSEYGLACRHAIISVGRDVWFMAAGRGVSSIRQTEQNKLQAVDVPVSDAIQPLIERINWAARAAIRAAKVGNFSYWAVPLDGATANSAVLVYDHLNQAWSGYDTGVAVQEFLPKIHAGVERLFVLTTAGYLGLYEELTSGVDQTGADAFTAIDFAVTTRGYGMRGKLGRNRLTRVELQLRTWAPEYSVLALCDGVEESATIASGKTKDRTKYFRPHTAARWVPSNWNDDHATPYREDYSIALGTSGTASGALVAGTRYLVRGGSIEYRANVGALALESGEVLGLEDGSGGIEVATGTIVNDGEFFVAGSGATYAALSGTPVVYGPAAYLNLGSGVDLDRQQETTEGYRVPKRARGQYVQVQVTNARGTVELCGVMTERVECDGKDGARG